MSEPRPDLYGLAHDRITSGAWAVDANSGTVVGSHGRPIGYRSSGGYVQLSMKAGRYEPCHRVYAHRVIWEHVHGAIPAGMQINHINGVKHDNRIVNLEVVTGAENVRHALTHGLTPPAPRGEQATGARLTEAEVRAMRMARAAGTPLKELAARYGIHKNHAGKITRRVAWTHVS